MKRKLFWAEIALLAFTVTVLIAAWPRFLPVIRMHGEPDHLESFEEMVNRAELIVLAEIKSVKQGPDYVSPIIGTSSFAHYPTQRITLEVVKIYKGEVAQGQSVTLYQEGVGVTWSIQDHPWPVFWINENDPIYERGERYILMLWTVPISEEVKPYQPEPWQEGMFSVIYPGRMRLNADGTVTSMLDSFGTNGKTLEEIEEKITAATATYPASYNGVTLPAPAQGAKLPPAWLVVGNIAVLGSGGSYEVTMIDDKGQCCLTEHGDAAPPPLYPDLATASLAADGRVVIVIGSRSIKEFHATVRPWTDEPALYSGAERELKAEAEPAGNATAFVLEPTGEAGDLLLLVSITFPVEFDPNYPMDNSASYLWRLNPVK